MPNNAILLVGLGLAAFTLFRREDSDVGESELVDASLLSSGTGDTGKALGVIPTIGSEGAEPVELVVTVNNKDTELPNELIGSLPLVPVTPFVQTPLYIISTGEQAGKALAQIGIQTHPDEVDLVTPTLYAEQIFPINGSGESGKDEFTSVTMTSPVQIVPGGANPGESYFTTLDTLGSARDVDVVGGGLFSLEPFIPVSTFDPQAAANALAIMSEPGWAQGITAPPIKEVRAPRVNFSEALYDDLGH